MKGNYNGEEILNEEPMFRTNAFLRKYKEQELPLLENSNGESLIKPTFRKQMKREFQQALAADLNDLLVVDLGAVVFTQDGMMLVASNDDEGCYTIQVDTKFKNLDYDPFDAVNAIDASR